MQSSGSGARGAVSGSATVVEPGLARPDLLEREAIASVLALVAVPADRLDVVAVPEALRRQVHRLDVVDVLGGRL